MRSRQERSGSAVVGYVPWGATVMHARKRREATLTKQRAGGKDRAAGPASQAGRATSGQRQSERSYRVLAKLRAKESVDRRGTPLSLVFVLRSLWD
jgi:hypothetical protein